MARNWRREKGVYSRLFDMGQHIFSSTDDRHQSITLRVYLVVYNELRVTQRVARVRLRSYPTVVLLLLLGLLLAA